MKTFLLALEQTEARIAALRALIAATPALSEWDCSGLGFQTSLLQFFPRVGRESEGTLASARKIALAFGGEWGRRSDGSWECDSARIAGVDACKIVLHHVEPPERSSKIDLA